MDILVSDTRFDPLRDFLGKDTNGNEVELKRLVDTVNASEIVRDQFAAVLGLEFQVIVTGELNTPQAEHIPGTDIIRIYLSPNGTPNENGLFITDALFSVIAHEIRHPMSSLTSVPTQLQHLPHGEAVGQESAIWGYAADNQAQISSDPQFGAQLRDAYVAARYREEQENQGSGLANCIKMPRMT